MHSAGMDAELFDRGDQRFCIPIRHEDNRTAPQQRLGNGIVNT
jgi:hypothetical protein